MMRDRVRMDAYEHALRHAVMPGSTVVDIGAGTGILSLLACRSGAGAVHAIEPSDAVHVAREIAKANGLADHITFVHALSTDVTLETRADLIVSDLRGVLPLFEHHLPTIIDARERLLKPGGQLIPRLDHLVVALVETAQVHDDLQQCWQFDEYDLDFSAIRRCVTSTPRRVRLESQHLCMDPQPLATLDYHRLQASNVEGCVTGVTSRAGTAHAVCLWFDTELCEGVGFSNAPGEPHAIYGQWLLPLSEPIAVAAGDAVTLRIHADLIGDDYLWRWHTTVSSAEGRRRLKADLRQSTFVGAPLSLDGLRKQADNYVPGLNAAGVVDATILASFAEQTPLGDIATRLTEEFGDRFNDWKSALRHVGKLVQRYSR